MHSLINQQVSLTHLQLNHKTLHTAVAAIIMPSLLRRCSRIIKICTCREDLKVYQTCRTQPKSVDYDSNQHERKQI